MNGGVYPIKRERLTLFCFWFLPYLTKLLCNVQDKDVN